MSSPIILGGGELIVVVNFRGAVIAVSPSDGVLQWTASLANSLGTGKDISVFILGALVRLFFSLK
jgi:hypothetical protein